MRPRDYAITIHNHKFMKTKHKLLNLIHQLGDTFDGTVNYFFHLINQFKFNGNGSNFKRILIRRTIKKCCLTITHQNGLHAIL